MLRGAEAAASRSCSRKRRSFFTSQESDNSYTLELELPGKLPTSQFAKVLGAGHAAGAARAAPFQTDGNRSEVPAPGTSFLPPQMRHRRRILQYAWRPRTLEPSHRRTLEPSHLAPSHPRTLAPSHPRTLIPSPPARSRLSVWRFCRSSGSGASVPRFPLSFDFSVSISIARPSKRRSWRMRRKGSSPRHPRPMCSCRSTRLPHGFRESFAWKTASRSRPTMRSNASNVSRYPRRSRCRSPTRRDGTYRGRPRCAPTRGGDR